MFHAAGHVENNTAIFDISRGMFWVPWYNGGKGDWFDNVGLASLGNFRFKIGYDIDTNNLGNEKYISLSGLSDGGAVSSDASSLTSMGDQVSFGSDTLMYHGAETYELVANGDGSLNGIDSLVLGFDPFYHEETSQYIAVSDTPNLFNNGASIELSHLSLAPGETLVYEASGNAIPSFDAATVGPDDGWVASTDAREGNLIWGSIRVLDDVDENGDIQSTRVEFRDVHARRDYNEFEDILIRDLDGNTRPAQDAYLYNLGQSNLPPTASNVAQTDAAGAPDATMASLHRLMPLEGEQIFVDTNGNGGLDSLLSPVTPTHVAVAPGGDWNDPASWASGTVPGEGAIVHIPMGVAITANGVISPDSDGDAQGIFMVRVDGDLTFTATNGTDTSMKVDTIFATHHGTFRIDADAATDGTVDIAISPFDLVNGNKSGWSDDAVDYFTDHGTITSDGSVTSALVEGWDGISDIEDGAGVLGRYHWDAEQLSLGIVTHGTVNVQGQAKAEQIAHAGLAQGATEMVLTGTDADDLNWSVGDRLVIASTNYDGFITGADTGFRTDDLNAEAVDRLRKVKTEDEVVRIKSIDVDDVTGAVTIAFADPAQFNDADPGASGSYALAHSHVPRQFTLEGAEVNTVTVANLSRNVTIRSDAATESMNSEISGANSIDNQLAPDAPEGYQEVGISGRLVGDHDVTDRGHVMFMHTDDIHVEAVAVRGMGRTDKTAALDSLLNPGHDVDSRNDIYFNTEDIPGDAGTSPANEIANQIGRYGLHIHQAGVDPDDPALGAWIEGSVVEGSVGWNFAHHGSEAILANNIAFDGVGTGFMAETGDEAGVWYNNLSLGITGFHNGGDVFLQSRTNDLGRSGNAFWLEGRGLALFENNAGSAVDGYHWSNEGPSQVNLQTSVLSNYDDYFALLNQRLGLTGADALQVRDGETLLDADGNPVLDANGSEVSILEAYRNGDDTVLTNGTMPIRYFSGNDATAVHQGITINTQHGHADRKMNDIWSILDDSQLTEVGFGVRTNYSSKYVFDDFRILAADNNENYRGIIFTASVRDNTISNSTLEGFNSGSNIIQIITAAHTNVGRSYHIDPSFNTAARLAPTEMWAGLEGGTESALHNLYNTNIYNLTTDVVTAPLGVAFSSSFADDFFDGLDGLPADYGDNIPDYIMRVYGDADIGSSTQVGIQLIEESDDLGVVALWREGFKTDAHYQAEFQTTDGDGNIIYEAPLNPFDGNELWQSGLRGTEPYATRNQYTDIWSGALLEFDKTDSIGTQRFAYDFTTENGERREYVTTNERIIFTPEQINAALANEGFHTLDGLYFTNADGGIEALKFVTLEMGFTDRISGDVTIVSVLVALDENWGNNGSVDWSQVTDNGVLTDTSGLIVSSQYSHYRDGVHIETLAVSDVVPDIIIEGTSGDDLIDAIYVGDPEGHSVTGGDDILVGGLGDDTLKGGGGDDVYVYALGDGHDVIDDRFGANTLDLSDFDSADAAFTVENSRDLMIEFADGRTVLVKDQFKTGPGQVSRISEVVFADDTLDTTAIHSKALADQSGGQEITGTSGWNDILQGDATDQTLAGGSGDDTYIYLVGDGHDVIEDRLGINTLDLSSTDMADVRFSADGARDLLIGFSDGGSVRVTDQFRYGPDQSDRISEVFFADGVLDETDIHDKAMADQIEDAIVQGTFGWDDRLQGDASDQTLIGSAGNDTYVYELGDGSDEIDDKSGINTLDLSGFNVADVTFRADGVRDLLIEFADGGSISVEDQFRLSADRTNRINEVIFADDTLDEAGVHAKALADQVGDAIVNGTFGWDDLLRGDPSDQVFKGSSGDDTYVYTLGDGHDEIDDRSGFNTLDLSSFDLADVVFRPDGVRDLVIEFADGGTMRLNDQFRHDAEQSNRISEILLADTTLDEIQIHSKALADQTGNVIIQGTIGWDDILQGDASDQVFKGSSGDDTFIYNLGDGHDRIEDRKGINTLDLSGVNAADVTFLAQGAYDLLIMFSDGGTVLVDDQFRYGVDQPDPISEVVFADGTFDGAAIDAKVVADLPAAAPLVSSITSDDLF